MGINKDSQKAPNLRFKGFTDDWEECKLSDITTINARIGWQNLRTSEFLDNGEYLLITGTDFKDGKIDYSNIHYIGKERYDQDKNIQIKNGSILITKDGTLGKVAYVEALRRPATLNAGVFNVQVTKEAQVNSKYLFHYLKAPFLLKYAASHSTGGTIKHLNKNILVDFPIPIPVNTEQIKIATLLSNFDKTITLHQRKLDQLNQLKGALLQQMFPGKGETVPKLRFAGFEGDWEERKLGELASITTGKLDANAMVEGGAYDFYTSGIKKYSIDKAAFEGPAITIAGNGATVGYMHLADGKFNAYQRTYVLTNLSSDRLFTFYEISNKLPKKIQQEARTGNIPYIVMDMLTELKLSIPNSREQNHIGTFFKSLDNTITLQQRKLDQLKTTKQVLLQNMFV